MDSLSLEDVLHRRGHILVLVLDQARSLLDDGHLAAEAPVHLREFEPDVAAADDDKVMRQDIEIQHGCVGQVADLVEAGHVGHERAAADIDEDRARRQQFLSDPDLVRCLETGMVFVDGAVSHALQPSLKSGARCAHDSVLPGLDFLHVDADRSAGCHAIVGGAPCKMSGIGTGNERLRGRASRVDAGSADELALDKGDAHAGSG